MSNKFQIHVCVSCQLIMSYKQNKDLGWNNFRKNTLKKLINERPRQHSDKFMISALVVKPWTYLVRCHII